MVFFSCDLCNEALRKNQVLKHSYKCRTNYVSCLDCFVNFDLQSFVSHNKCISEEQKFHGSTYKPKVNKGEKKQDAWTEIVSHASKKAKTNKQKAIFERIQNADNVPRKLDKFCNFVANCVRVKNRPLAVEVFEMIKAAEAEMKAAEQPAKEDKPEGVKEKEDKEPEVPKEEEKVDEKEDEKSSKSEENEDGNAEEQEAPKKSKKKRSKAEEADN